MSRLRYDSRESPVVRPLYFVSSGRLIHMAPSSCTLIRRGTCAIRVPFCFVESQDVSHETLNVAFEMATEQNDAAERHRARSVEYSRFALSGVASSGTQRLSKPHIVKTRLKLLQRRTYGHAPRIRL